MLLRRRWRRKRSTAITPRITITIQPIATPALAPVERPPLDALSLDGFSLDELWFELWFELLLDLSSLDDVCSGPPVSAVRVAELVAGEFCAANVDEVWAGGVCEAAASREYEAETDRIDDTTSSFFRTMNPREGTVFCVSTNAAFEELTGFMIR